VIAAKAASAGHWLLPFDYGCGMSPAAESAPRVSFFTSAWTAGSKAMRQADDADAVALIDVFGEAAAQGDELDHQPVGGLEADDRLVVVLDLPCIAAARPAARRRRFP